jgi:dihydrofolate reductase
MGGTVWHCHVAMSLDGRIARADGSVDWLEAYPSEEFGLDDFYARVDTIVMGRGTYDAAVRMGAWPYGDKPVVVLTTRPLEDGPTGVEVRAGDAAAVAAEIERRGDRLVWLMGGGQMVRAFAAIGRLDVLEMAVIPVVLGTGPALFPSGTSEMRLRLVRCEARSGGALHMVYERER